MAQVSRQAESLVNEYAEIEALAEEILTEKRQVLYTSQYMAPPYFN